MFDHGIFILKSEAFPETLSMACRLVETAGRWAEDFPVRVFMRIEGQPILLLS